MNFLAHATVCSNGPDELAFANVMSDLFPRTSSSDTTLPQEVQDGRQLHLELDRYFERIQAFGSIRNSLFAIVGHLYDPVLDVTCDHVLASNWPDLIEEDLGTFTKGIYEIITPRIHLLSIERRGFAQVMASHDVLSSYKTRYGLEAALKRLSGRTKHGKKLYENVPKIVDLIPMIEEVFLMALPDINEYAQEKLLELGYAVEGGRLHWCEGVLDGEINRNRGIERI